MQQSRTDFDEAAPRTEVTTRFNPADHLGFSKIAAWIFREVIRFGFNSDVVAELSTDPSAEPERLFCLRAELDGRHLKTCFPLVLPLSLCVRGSDRKCQHYNRSYNDRFEYRLTFAEKVTDEALAMPSLHRFAPRVSL